MDRVRKPNISESYTPSSESYSNYFLRFGVASVRIWVYLHEYERNSFIIKDSYRNAVA
jgi:hypothetical protein